MSNEAKTHVNKTPYQGEERRNLSTDEQFLLSISNRIAKVEAWQIDFDKGLKKVSLTDETEAKIKSLYNQSVSLWVFFRDRVIPPVLVGVIVWYLTHK